MPATRRIVLDLPADTVDAIEARVAAGEYASASDLVATELDDHLGWLASHEGSPEWRTLMADCDEIERRIDAGEERLIPADEALAALHEHVAHLRRDEDAARAAG